VPPPENNAPKARSPDDRSPDSRSSDSWSPDSWSPDSWRGRPQAQAISYPDHEAVDRTLTTLRALPPLVTSWEIERLRNEIAQAAQGKRFILQGGDCAETLADCRPEVIANKLKILLQMSLVLVHGLKQPVTRVGRIAGQYAKPRSSMTERGVLAGGDGAATELPSYFGDLVNLHDFTPEARTPNPELLLRAYERSALTLNFIRSLLEGGFADLHHPEQWDLSFFDHADLPGDKREQYQRLVGTLADGIRFMEALGEARIHEMQRVEFFTSHEGLNLLYESAQTRQVPRREGWWDLTTHMPWIGERTRQPDGAHVEFFRGVENPVGLKAGPDAQTEDIVAAARALNPRNEPGKLVIIHRMGAGEIARRLPPLLHALGKAGLQVAWLCDPMHGNGITTRSGMKTRSFDDILVELESAIDIHHAQGTVLAGVHFELTGDDVTECLGGSAGVTEHDLTANYASPCDPRLNYQQALELAFLLSGKLGQTNISKVRSQA